MKYTYKVGETIIDKAGDKGTILKVVPNMQIEEGPMEYIVDYGNGKRCVVAFEDIVCVKPLKENVEYNFKNLKEVSEAFTALDNKVRKAITDLANTLIESNDAVKELFNGRSDWFKQCTAEVNLLNKKVFGVESTVNKDGTLIKAECYDKPGQDHLTTTELLEWVRDNLTEILKK